MTNFKYRCAEIIYNYWWGKSLLHWLKDGICVITLLILYPQIPNLSQYNTINFINEIPKDANI